MGFWRSGHNLRALSANKAGQLDVLGHDMHPLCVDGTQFGVLEQTDQVSLAGLLQGHHGGALEAQVGLEEQGDFSPQALEGHIAEEQLSGALVTTDLSETRCRTCNGEALLRAALAASCIL